jgi:hypothetical protein
MQSTRPTTLARTQVGAFAAGAAGNLDPQFANLAAVVVPRFHLTSYRATSKRCGERSWLHAPVIRRRQDLSEGLTSRLAVVRKYFRLVVIFVAGGVRAVDGYRSYSIIADAIEERPRLRRHVLVRRSVPRGWVRRAVYWLWVTRKTAHLTPD